MLPEIKWARLTDVAEKLKSEKIDNLSEFDLQSLVDGLELNPVKAKNILFPELELFTRKDMLSLKNYIKHYLDYIERLDEGNESAAANSLERCERIYQNYIPRNLRRVIR